MPWAGMEISRRRRRRKISVTRTCRHAARGHRDAEMVAANGCPWTKWTRVRGVLRHLEVLKWPLNGCSGQWTAANAAKGGDLEVLMGARERPSGR